MARQGVVCFAAGRPAHLQSVFQDGGAILEPGFLGQQLSQAPLQLLHLASELCELRLLPLAESALSLRQVTSIINASPVRWIEKAEKAAAWLATVFAPMGSQNFIRFTDTVLTSKEAQMFML